MIGTRPNALRDKAMGLRKIMGMVIRELGTATIQLGNIRRVVGDLRRTASNKVIVRTKPAQ